MDGLITFAKMVGVAFGMGLLCLLGIAGLVVVFWQVVRFVLWTLGLIDD